MIAQPQPQQQQQDILNRFIFKQFLSVNATEKRVVALGTLTKQLQDQQSQQQQAIMIIQATLPCQPPYTHSDIKLIFKNDIYYRYDTLTPNKYEIQVVYPITNKHKQKYRLRNMLMIEQTAQQYQNNKQVLLEKQLKHIGWVNNIIEGKAEVERVLFKCQQFVLLPDFKYSDLTNTQNLHLLCIFTDDKLASLRDLRGSHVDLLRKVQKQIEKVMVDRFSMEKGSYRMYYHYPPTFYRMHLHITNLRVIGAIALADRAHLLQHVISNLTICPDFYQKATLIKMQQKAQIKSV